MAACQGSGPISVSANTFGGARGCESHHFVIRGHNRDLSLGPNQLDGQLVQVNELVWAVSRCTCEFSFLIVHNQRRYVYTDRVRAGGGAIAEVPKAATTSTTCARQYVHRDTSLHRASSLDSPCSLSHNFLGAFLQSSHERCRNWSTRIGSLIKWLPCPTPTLAS